MRGRTLFRVGFLAFVISQSHLALCLAQSNACPDTSSDETESSEGPKVIIDNIEYSADNPLSDAQQSAVLSAINKATQFRSNESIQEQGALDDLSFPVWEALWDAGYFRAVVTPKIFLIRAEPGAVRYVLSISIHSGLQYHLASMHFRSADPDHPGLAFSESEIRQQFEMKNGDLISVLKIRQGLDSLKKLYYSKGFIDMVPTPSDDTHERDARHDDADEEGASDAKIDTGIDLTIKIDEGKSYLISKIEVLGLPLTAVQQLQLPQVAGDVFNHNLWKDYFDKDAPPLPKDASQDKNMRFLVYDAVHHIISFGVDFRSCDSTPSVPITYSEVGLPDSSTPANLLGTMRTKSEPENPNTSDGAPAPE